MLVSLTLTIAKKLGWVVFFSVGNGEVDHSVELDSVLFEFLAVSLSLREAHQDEAILADSWWLVGIKLIRFSHELINIQIVDLDLFFALLETESLKVLAIHDSLLTSLVTVSFRLGGLIFSLLFGLLLLSNLLLLGVVKHLLLLRHFI